jgi:hypothetical protein
MATIYDDVILFKSKRARTTLVLFHRLLMPLLIQVCGVMGEVRGRGENGKGKGAVRRKGREGGVGKGKG